MSGHAVIQLDKRLNVLNRFRDPVLRHFAWDFTDFLMFGMWACIYGMHVHHEDQGSFSLICLFCLIPGTILLYMGGRDLFFSHYNVIQKFLFVGYFLILPWAGILELMLFKGDSTGDDVWLCGVYKKWNLLENPLLNLGRNWTEDCSALAKKSNSSGHDVMGAIQNISSFEDYKDVVRGFQTQYEAYFCPEFKVMVMCAILWFVGLLGLSNPREKPPVVNSNGDLPGAGEGTDATTKPLLPASDASGGAARSKEPMNPVLAKHLLNELVYDCFALSIQVWLLTEIRMKDTSFPYKVFIDFVNLSTTFVDLCMVKGPSFFLHILKTGGSLEKILELLLQTAEELEQQAQGPGGDENTPDEGRPQEAEHMPHASSSQSAGGGGVVEP